MIGDADAVADHVRFLARCDSDQMSIFSAISIASSTSMSQAMPSENSIGSIRQRSANHIAFNLALIEDDFAEPYRLASTTGI